MIIESLETRTLLQAAPTTSTALQIQTSAAALTNQIHALSPTQIECINACEYDPDEQSNNLWDLSQKKSNKIASCVTNCLSNTLTNASAYLNTGKGLLTTAYNTNQITQATALNQVQVLWANTLAGIESQNIQLIAEYNTKQSSINSTITKSNELMNQVVGIIENDLKSIQGQLGLMSNATNIAKADLTCQALQIQINEQQNQNTALTSAIAAATNQLNLFNTIYTQLKDQAASAV